MSLNRALLCSFLFFSHLQIGFSQEPFLALDEKHYSPPKRIKKTDFDQLLISDLKGIILIPSFDQVVPSQELASVTGVEIRDLALPGPAEQLQKELDRFLGKPLTLKDAYEIKNTVARFYEANYHPLVILEIPTQDISSHIFQLVVIESRLGQFRVEGNEKWSRLDRIQKNMHLTPGDPIDSRLLVRDLNFLNRSPYRQVEMVYEPGESEGTTDVLLLVQDERPYKFYIGTDNTGLQDTISTLFFAGLNYGNCFGLGHSFSYQYTTSNFHALQAHTVQYLAPLSNLHVLNVYGGYAQVYPELSFPYESNSGYSIQSSVRYQIPLIPNYRLSHDFTTGIDFKRTNTALLYSSSAALAPFNQSVNLTQAMLGYSGSYQDKSYLLTYLAELYFSPVKWLPDQSDEDYAALRPGAKNQWVYLETGLHYYQKLPKSFFMTLFFRGQVSSCSLLPSEQLGIGGFDTVRGYYERVLNYDNGVIANLEVHSPSLNLVPLFSKNSALTDSLDFLLFIDYGWGINYTLLPGEAKQDYLFSTGPGLRYNLDKYLNCRADYGIKLHKGTVIGTTPGYFHFSVIASY